MPAAQPMQSETKFDCNVCLSGNRKARKEKIKKILGSSAITTGASHGGSPELNSKVGVERPALFI